MTAIGNFFRLIFVGGILIIGIGFLSSIEEDDWVLGNPPVPVESEYNWECSCGCKFSDTISNVKYQGCYCCSADWEMLTNLGRKK